MVSLGRWAHRLTAALQESDCAEKTSAMSHSFPASRRSEALRSPNATSCSGRMPSPPGGVAPGQCYGEVQFKRRQLPWRMTKTR